MKVLFASAAVKPIHLKVAGHAIINPQLDDDDFDCRLRCQSCDRDRKARLFPQIRGCRRGTSTVQTPLFQMDCVEFIIDDHD